MSLPKYKYLLSYRYAEIICDLNVVFCKRHIDKRSRTFDQMIQAARSGKQNIVEGVIDGRTSTKIELKLLGVAMGSFEELLADYEDFLRQKGLSLWSKDDIRIASFRKRAFQLSSLSNLSDLGELKEKPKLPADPETGANLLLTLCHQVTYLLSKQITAAEEKFLNEGGYSENLLRKRLDRRTSQNQ